MLVEQHRDIGGRSFTRESLQGREAHHEGRHFVFIKEYDLVGVCLVISKVTVTPEQSVEQLCDIVDDDVEFLMQDPQLRSS